LPAKPIRTRFAPSPTGSLHVGNVRAAILNWLLTRQQGGQFILRIEDTDLERNVEDSEQQIMQDLLWLGLDWDEGPLPDGENRGDYGPYRQSQRLDSYRAYAQRLRKTGAAFECYCTTEELEAHRAAAVAGGTNARYPGTCRNATAEQIAAWRLEGRAAALRFRMPENRDLVVRDVVYGDVSVRSDEIGDFIILRSDGLPTYNFAVVVDDILMEITHVIRGVGHLSNTHRQVILYEAFEHAKPVFAHFPMVLGPDRQKLSKRHGAQAVSDYAAEGYHPDALLNYMSLLGWSSPTGQEFLTREELIQQIDLARIGTADVVFDPAKLSWLSAKHIERMSLADLVVAVRPFVAPEFSIDDEKLAIVLSATRTHLARFTDVNEQLALFLATDGQPQRNRVTEVAAAILVATPWDEASLGAAIKQVGAEAGVKGKALYEPLRLALTGVEHGPPLAAVMLVQGKDTVLRRLQP
jgi:nondiscriminating glutamyl-tRNA synthetase